MRFTQAEYDAYIQRGFHLPPKDNEADDGPEKVLQRKIVTWAKDWGHPCLSFRQSKNAIGFITPGWPDITLILHKQRVVFLELKSKKGRMSEDQKMMRLQLLSHGQEIYEVRSYKQFLQIVETDRQRGMK